MADLQEAYKVAAYLALERTDSTDQLSDEAAPTPCACCSKPATRDCGRCKNVKYCDNKCQKADWVIHKYMCGPDQDTRPTPTHRGAILLPETSERLTLVWIDTCTEDFIEQGLNMMFTEESQQVIRSTRADPIESSDPFHSSLARQSGDGLTTFAKINGTYPKTAGLLGKGADEVFDTAALVGGIRGGDEHIDHSINVCYRDSMRVDGVSKPNKVLEHLNKDKVNAFWRGPLVIFGMAKSAGSPTCVDLRACDLGLAIRGLARIAKEKLK
ncbi:hypothetical protein LTR27_002444 [Elasticomyces elasticus]|nr:hypothetical protein LTR27_002444 [Elasticomyces elasticus]